MQKVNIRMVEQVAKQMAAIFREHQEFCVLYGVVYQVIRVISVEIWGQAVHILYFLGILSLDSCRV